MQAVKALTRMHIMLIVNSKTCVKRPLKNRQILMTNGSFKNDDQKYCRMLPLDSVSPRPF